MARKTLDAARALFDPVWGGVYQYSTYGDWQHPHFEKLATVQGQYLRIYALASAAFGKPADAQAVREIKRYVDAFLKSPDGAFYVSQDADLKPGEHSNDYFALDDAKRRARRRAARRHSTSIRCRTDRSSRRWRRGASCPATKTVSTKRSTRPNWIIAHRALAGGGFRHDEHDAQGPYLGDSLAMGRAFLALYRATADRAWLAKASATADFIAANFARTRRRFRHGEIVRTDRGDAADGREHFHRAFRQPARPLRRQARTCRDGRKRVALSRRAAVALSEITEPGILLADDEDHADPLHLTVSGAKSDASAAALFSTLQHLPQWYKRIEWWDRAEGDLPNPDVGYPPTKRAAAFVCTESRCSLPIYTSDEVTAFLKSSNANKRKPS